MVDNVKREKHESRTNIEASETITFGVGDYEVFVWLRDSLVEVSIAPKGWDRARLGLVKCYPKRVGDLEAFGRSASMLFSEIAATLRAEGLDDLRSRSDKYLEEMDAKRTQMLADLRAER